MARTFNASEATSFAEVMAEINRLKAEVAQSDEGCGTARPEGASLGVLYERLGIHLVAMYNCGVSPLHAIRLIAQMAEHADEIEAATMIALLQSEAGGGLRSRPVTTHGC
jgi:hypothetical protein